MRIVTYDLEKDENDMPMLVKESCKYSRDFYTFIIVRGNTFYYCTQPSEW